MLLAAGQGALAAPDTALQTAAEQAVPALIETLHDMVMIESGSTDTDGLARMADFTEARLKALGFATERRKTTKGAGADIVIAAVKMARRKWNGRRRRMTNPETPQRGIRCAPSEI